MYSIVSIPNLASDLYHKPPLYLHISLSTLAADATSQLNVPRHNGNPLGMNSAQVDVLKEGHKVCFCCLLECQYCVALEPQFTLFIPTSKFKLYLDNKIPANPNYQKYHYKIIRISPYNLEQFHEQDAGMGVYGSEAQCSFGTCGFH